MQTEIAVEEEGIPEPEHTKAYEIKEGFQPHLLYQIRVWHKDGKGPVVYLPPGKMDMRWNMTCVEDPNDPEFREENSFLMFFFEFETQSQGDKAYRIASYGKTEKEPDEACFVSTRGGYQRLWWRPLDKHSEPQTLWRVERVPDDEADGIPRYQIYTVSGGARRYWAWFRWKSEREGHISWVTDSSHPTSYFTIETVMEGEKPKENFEPLQIIKSPLKPFSDEALKRPKGPPAGPATVVTESIIPYYAYKNQDALATWEQMRNSPYCTVRRFQYFVWEETLLAGHQKTATVHNALTVEKTREIESTISLEAAYESFTGSYSARVESELRVQNTWSAVKNTSSTVEVSIGPARYDRDFYSACDNFAVIVLTRDENDAQKMVPASSDPPVTPYHYPDRQIMIKRK